MNKILEQIGLIGVVPVVVMEDEKFAEPLAQALVDGGLPCAEVTFRTNAAKNVIARMTKSQKSMLVGAGTVTSVEQAKAAVDAGAKFIVSPGLNKYVAEYCLNNEVTVIPGAATPTEIGTAVEMGLDVVKIFPAEEIGGLNYLRAISAPYKEIKFIPTGGINEKNIVPYLNFSRVLACGGSWMVKQDLISGGRFAEIKRLVSEAVTAVLGFEVRHIGINSGSADAASELSARIGRMFNMALKDGKSSIFVGIHFEILKSIGQGEKGHIAVCTNSVKRAIAYLERNGVGILPGTSVEKDGNIYTVYLDTDIGGFTVHLVQKL